MLSVHYSFRFSARQRHASYVDVDPGSPVLAFGHSAPVHGDLNINGTTNGRSSILDQVSSGSRYLRR